MEIKLLAVDMDETVVNSRHQMTEQTKLALELAIQKGILVVPVTGRCLEGLPARFVGWTVWSSFITSNGAKAYDFKEQRILYRRLMPKSDRLCDHWKKVSGGRNWNCDPPGREVL